MPTFTLVRSKQTGLCDWKLDGGDRWINRSGGYFFKGNDDEIVEEAEAEGLGGLDWSFRYDGFDDDWTTGYLRYDGKLFPCQAWEHDTMAFLNLNYDGCANPSEMEERGWVRLWGVGSDPEFSNERTLSAEQRNWMSRMGFSLEDFD